MKIIELLNKVHVPITNEESDLLGRFNENPQVSKKELNLREQTIANSLVNKDILFRKQVDGQVYYKKKI
jgi:hypothetical protein